MSIQLDYASPTPPPLRLGRLALGAAILALGSIIQTACTYISELFALMVGVRGQMRILANATIINDLAMLAAVPLLAAALPPDSDTNARHWKRRICLALAGALLISDAVHVSTVLAFFDSNAFLFLPEPRVSFTHIPLKLALLLCADLYLIAVGRHLGSRALGVVAACALSLTALATLAVFLNLLFRLPYLPRNPLMGDSYLDDPSVASTAGTIVYTLLWFSIALFAAILALTNRRRA